MNKIALIGAALAALSAAPAFAQPTRDARPRLAQPLTRAAVVARVQARFARLDANRDGFVTQDEVHSRRDASIGQRQARRGPGRAALFARLDSNRDGVLSREEFQALRGGFGDGVGRGPRGERFGGQRGGRGFGARMNGGLFAAVDVNRDGRVSLQEASSRALQLFDRADANRDGIVTPEERRTARQAFRAQRRG